jgi:large subunit ribosomal protein L3
MIRGLIAQKVGMTQIFDKDGNSIPVTVVVAGPCPILGIIDAPQKKVKLGFQSAKESRVSKPELGFFKKIGVNPVRVVKEFESTDNKDYKVGQELKADLFKAGDFVNVTGVSTGKGFQGGMKRWNWAGGPGKHGSMHHRRVGSIGASADPSRTYVGQHMPGHMGAETVTVEGLRVIKVDVENNLILVKGAIPGQKRAIVYINRSNKKAYRSLDEKKAVFEGKKNPLKASKKAAGATGKAAAKPAAAAKGGAKGK